MDAALSTVTVLVVEDCDAIRNLIKKILEQSKYLVLAASNGKDAIKLAQTHEIDIVVSDIDMPEMNGIELFNVLHHQCMPVIFMTSHQEILNSEKAIAMGAREYLKKPFSKADLLAAVDKVIYQINSGFTDVDPVYDQIPIDDLINGKGTGRDLFLRFSTTKYIMVAQDSVQLAVDRFKDLKQKGLRFLYAKKK
jgi:CheY-like chemotaxis protein